MFWLNKKPPDYERVRNKLVYFANNNSKHVIYFHLKNAMFYAKIEDEQNDDIELNLGKNKYKYFVLNEVLYVGKHCY